MEIGRGEAVGLLGSNGSGKSTILRVLATLIKPNAGSGSVNGLDLVRDAAAVRAQVGYLAHAPGLYDDLTARENLLFAADMLGVQYAGADTVLARVGLTHAANDRVRGFSAGMLRRLALARLVLRNPKFLLLDEPYSNLDSDGVALVNSIVGEIVRSGGAALIALHELAPARQTLQRSLTIRDGRIAEVPSSSVTSELPTPVPVTH